jgi:hypothetical protein
MVRLGGGPSRRCSVALRDTPLTTYAGTANLVGLYERPACQVPPRPFFYLSFFPSFFLFDRAAGFLPPRPRIVAGRRAQMLSRLAALQRPHPPGPPAFTAIEHDGRLDESGRLRSCLFYPHLRVSARYSDGGCFLADLATKSMARATFASTYVRQLRSGLPRCCLHGRSCRRNGTHLSNSRSGADLRSRPTVTHPTRQTLSIEGVGTQRKVDAIV